MKIAIDIPKDYASAWRIAAGAQEFATNRRVGIGVLLPHATMARAEDCDRSNWDGAIVDTPRPDLAVPQVCITLGHCSEVVSVTVDIDSINKLAIDQFVSMGLGNLGYFGNPDWGHSRMRWDSFSRQVETLGLEPVCIDARDPFETLNQIRKPCGIMAFNDYLGNLLVRRSQEIGMRIPGDIHVISVGNSRKCLKTSPQLSSVVMPFVELGAEAARLCLRQIEGMPVESVRLPASGLIIRDSIKVENDDIKTATELAHYLRTNFSYPIQMVDVVRRSSMSRRRLEEIFRASYGSSPMAYLKDVRLEKAKEMLVSSDAPLKEIVDTCGYRDSNQICRIFRDRLDMTPLSYRDKNRDSEI